MKIVKGLFLAALLPFFLASCGGGEGGGGGGESVVGKWKIEEIQMGDMTMGADMLGEATIEFTDTEMISTGMGADQSEPYKIEDGYIVGEDADDKMKIEKCTSSELVLKGDMGGQEGTITLSKM